MCLPGLACTRLTFDLAVAILRLAWAVATTWAVACGLIFAAITVVKPIYVVESTRAYLSYSSLFISAVWWCTYWLGWTRFVHSPWPLSMCVVCGPLHATSLWAPVLIHAQAGSRIIWPGQCFLLFKPLLRLPRPDAGLCIPFQSNCLEQCGNDLA